MKIRTKAVWGACVLVAMVAGLPVTALAQAATPPQAPPQASDPDSRLDPLQQAFLECGGTQCGICTPGMHIAARALLDANPRPTRDEIKEAIAGNLCRCTGYVKIIDAIAQAAGPSLTGT